MVEVLGLGREFGPDALRTAIAATVSLGVCTKPPDPIDVGVLAMPSLVDYVEAGNHSAAAMEAKLPRMKTPGYFPNLIVPGPRPFDCTLAEGDYVAKAGLVLLAGEADTGEPTWRLGLAWPPVASGVGCGSTATGLINELAEAAHANQLRRTLGR